MTDVVSLAHARATIDDNGVACLWIVSENHLNILGTPVIKDLISALDQLKQRPEVRVLVLRGQGDKAFVAGANIKEMASLDRAGAERFISGLRDLCEAVRQFPTPVIARIPGWCLGGGLELAMACDVRLAAAGSQFGMPEVKVGIPSVIHAVLMPAMIGPTQASWMLLSGELVGTDQALAWGLVTEVVAADQLDLRLAQMTKIFSELAPAAVAQQKRLLRRWEKLSVTDAINDTVSEFGKAFETGEPAHFMGQWVKGNA